MAAKVISEKQLPAMKVTEFPKVVHGVDAGERALPFVAALHTCGATSGRTASHEVNNKLKRGWRTKVEA